VERLGEVLLSIGAVSAGALSRALMMQRSAGGRLGTILLEQGFVTEETLARALGKVTGRPYAYWDRVRRANPETIAALPAKVAIRAFAVPFEREGRILRLAMRDPNDLAAQDEIAFVTGKKIEAWSISEVRLFEALERFYGERCPARYRVLADRLDRGIRPQPPLPPPPPPPDLRGQEKPAEAANGLPSPAPPSRPADLWRAVTTGADEIEIATWRPTPFVKPPPVPPAAPIELEVDERHAESDRAAVRHEDDRAASPPPPAQEGIPSTAPPATVPPATPAPAISEGMPKAIPEREANREAPRPATVGAARERILEAETRDDIADAALSYIEPFFPLVALLIARKEDVIGWQVRGGDSSRSAFKTIRISLKEPSIFLNVKLSGTPYQGRLPDLPSHEPVLEAIGVRPERCAVFPVVLRKRVVAFLFLEYSGPVLARERAEELKALSSAIADGLAALIVQQRARP